MGSVSNPPRDRGVDIRRRPVWRNAFRTGRDRRRSRSASGLYFWMIGAMSRAASMSDVSVSQCMAFTYALIVVRGLLRWNHVLRVHVDGEGPSRGPYELERCWRGPATIGDVFDGQDIEPVVSSGAEVTHI